MIGADLFLLTSVPLLSVPALSGFCPWEAIQENPLARNIIKVKQALGHLCFPMESSSFPFLEPVSCPVGDPPGSHR